MREFGEIRSRFFGTTDIAQGYLGQARALLGIVEQQRDLGGLGQLSRTFTLPDGAVIAVRAVPGNMSVDITTPAEALSQQLQELGVSIIKQPELIPDTTPETPISHFTSLVVVGEWDDAIGNGHSFIWTKHTGMEEIPYLPGCFFGGATGISADGRVVVGTCGGDAGDFAYRWTKNGGTQDLGPLGGDHNQLGATGISADGTVISGHGFDSGAGSAVSWNWHAATKYTVLSGSNGTYARYGNPGISPSAKYTTMVTGSADGAVHTKEGVLAIPRPGTSFDNLSIIIIDVAGVITKAHLGNITIFDRSIPAGVSDSGIVVGNTGNAGMFVWNLKTNDYTLVGSGETAGRQVSATGMVVGNWVDAASSQAFYWSGKTSAPFLLGPGFAYAVSSDGATIAGGAGAVGALQPAIWNKKGGKATLVTPSGAVNAWVTAIATPQL